MAEILAVLIVMCFAMVFILLIVAGAAAVLFPIFGKLIRPLFTALWLAREAKALREDPKAHVKAHLDRRVQAEAKRRTATKSRTKSRNRRSRARTR